MLRLAVQTDEKTYIHYLDAAVLYRTTMTVDFSHMLFRAIARYDDLDGKAHYEFEWVVEDRDEFWRTG